MSDDPRRGSGRFPGPPSPAPKTRGRTAAGKGKHPALLPWKAAPAARAFPAGPFPAKARTRNEGAPLNPPSASKKGYR